MSQINFTPRLPVKIEDLSRQDLREDWINNKNMKVFTLLNSQSPLFLLDVFAEHPLEFEEMFLNSKVLSYEEGKVRICSIDDLIKLKEMSGRPKDLQDIETLKIIKQGT